MVITASDLRANIYKVLDRVLATGVPVEIKRKGKKLYIVPPVETDKLKRLKKRSVMKDEPDAFVHLDWYREWKK